MDCYFLCKCCLQKQKNPKKLCFIAPLKKSIIYHSLDASFIDIFLFVHLFIQNYLSRPHSLPGSALSMVNIWYVHKYLLLSWREFVLSACSFAFGDVRSIRIVNPFILTCQLCQNHRLFRSSCLALLPSFLIL